MSGEYRGDGTPAIDEGSWVYLIAADEGRTSGTLLNRRVIEACEKSGWPAISWSPSAAVGATDPGRYFEGVRHAVEHADVVIALMGATEEMADAELALAYSHRRPIIGLQVNGRGSPASGIQAMLQSYERARVITCDDAEECVVELHSALSDPSFVETVRQAAGEHDA